MKNSKAKEIIVPAVSLFLICVVVTALLALTNAVTAPKIDALAVETQDASKKQVLSSAASFSEEKQVEKDGVSYTYYDGLTSDGSVYEGGQTVTVAAPIEYMPVFERL